MLKNLRNRLGKVRAQKSRCFADFEPLIKKILSDYGHLFPRFQETRKGSIYVYHFNVEGIFPISLHKEHGNRDSIPPKFAKRAIQGIEDVLTFIEQNEPNDQEIDAEGEATDARATDNEEAARILPEPKIPDGDC